jgi:nitrate/nitrite-specific signal transduction histidine kinase
LQIIQNQSAVLLQQTDKVMGAYQSAATEKATRSRIIIQIGFVTSATLLLAFGGWAINRSVISPLKQLQRVTERIGENDFDTQAQIEGPREMRLLAQSFETMRNNLLASKTEMAELAESLERRVAQRTRELEALNEVSREIASHLDVQHVLDLVTEKTRSLLDGEVAALCLMDENDKWLNLQSVNGPKESIIGKRVEVAGSSTDAILHGTQAQLCNGKKCLSGCGILSDDYIASHIIAPLQVGDCVVGALCVGLPEQNRYSNESSSLLTKLASVAAIALDNARLYAQAERVATLEERRRVAAEMHDGLGQTLSYLGLTTEQAMEFLANGQSKIALERLQKMRNVIEKTTGEVRRAINNLMDEAPLAFDLSVRLHSAVDEFTANGLSVTWQAEADVADCPRQVAEQVVNVAREALNNVVRHAQAREVKVKMGKMDSQYFMAVEDDGQGFDSSQAEPQGHFGLQIMQARATHIGGRVQIESTQGCGTRVTLVWPPVGIGE